MSEIVGTIGPLRYRLGDECGDIFAEDDDFDGLTLTVEVRDEAEGRRLIDALRSAVERPDPLGEALNSGDGVRPGIPDDVLDEVEMARTICFAWGHCAGGCQLKGARCLGDADSLLHSWQGRCANAALARLREAREADDAPSTGKEIKKEIYGDEE